MILLVLLALPLVAIGVSQLAPGRRAAPAATLVASSLTLLASLRVLGLVLATGNVVGVRGEVETDSLGALVLLLVAWVGWLAALFSWGYLEAGEEHRSDARIRFYYVHLNLFLLALLAVPVVADPAFAWIAVEFTALFSVLLVAYERRHSALEAAWKYIALMLLGAAIALLGFLILFWAQHEAGGTAFTWAGLRATSGMPPRLVATAFVLVLVGLGTKAGLVPMHTWLPDAHSEAPSPVCALLSAVKTTVALYCILRLVPLLPVPEVSAWAKGAGLLSVGTAAFLLLQVHDYKRMFAYSTVEHMGIVLAAVGLGPAGPLAALLQLLAHGVTKSFCFFASGSVLLSTGTREIGAVRGLLRRAPVAGAAFVLGALAIAGVPPMVVFSSEFSVFRAGLSSGAWLATSLLALFVVVAFFGILRHVTAMSYGAAEPDPVARPPVRLPLSCRLTLLFGALPPLVLGLWQPSALHVLVVQAARVLAP